MKLQKAAFFGSSSGRMCPAQSGMTLVEVMMAVAVHMIGVLALLGVFQQSASSGRQADMTYTAYNLAKNHLERLRAVNFGVVASAGEVATMLNQAGVADPNGPYVRSTTVTPFPGYTSTLAQVTVSVFYRWKGKESAPTSVTSLIYGG